MTRLARFETAGVRDALRVWDHWDRWCRGRGLDPLADDSAGSPLIIDEFITQSNRGARTTGRRIWLRLRWLEVYLRAPFRLEAAMRPTLDDWRGGRPEPAQATVIEPCMVACLEDALAAALHRRSWEAVPAAAALAMCFGWVRYRHITRSFPVERTKHLAWFRCHRGKQGAPFDWCLPRRPDLCCAADVLWDAWHRLAERRKATGEVPRGLVFHEGTGRSVSLGSFCRFLRSEIGQCLDDAAERKLITSYSLRRLMPTFSDSIKLPWEERVVAGGWTCGGAGGGAGGPNVMPLRYAGTRREQQGFVRLYLDSVFEAARSLDAGAVRFEHVKAWWDTPEAQRVSGTARARAAEFLTEQLLPERARFIPDDVAWAAHHGKKDCARSVASSSAPRTVFPP